MIKKVLIIVPHEDDEINIAGTIIDQFHKMKITIDIIYVTNGDFYPNKTQKRIREAMNVAKDMQVNKLYFLGYGDRFCDKHIYPGDKNEVVTSKAGYNETYGIEGIIDYRYLVDGVHSEYKLSNIKKDMHDCILQIRADLIICVDFDDHPDHRMVSLIFEEVMKKVIVKDDYKPLILKKFAYAGVWEGEHDYFISPMKPTCPVANNEEYRKKFWQYNKSDEVRIKVSDTNYQLKFWKTDVYKWLKIYRSQRAVKHFSSIVNADALYFFRNSNNLALKADVEVSSGEGKYLNDFKLIDTDDVCVMESDYMRIVNESTWLPDREDEDKNIVFKFRKEISVKRIAFYQSLDQNSGITQLYICFNDNEGKVYKIDKNNIRELYFEEENVKLIKIKILKHYGRFYGFSEIEVFNCEDGFRWQETPFCPYIPDKATLESRHMIYEMIYKTCLFFSVYIPGKFMGYCKKAYKIISKYSI